MSKTNRSILLGSFVPAFLLGVCAVAQAAPTNWSDPAGNCGGTLLIDALTRMFRGLVPKSSYPTKTF